MEKIEQLLETLEKVMADNDLDSKEKLNSTVNRIAGFYIEHYKINKDEVAIFLINQKNTALYFVYPIPYS